MQGINGGEPLSIAEINEGDRLALAADRKAENRKHRFHLVPFEDIQLGTEPQYLVKGIIPRVGLTVIWGPPKSGKSFWTFDVAMHVALGREYRGRRVQQGPVVYCAFEGQSGISARVEAFRKTFPIPAGVAVPFYLEPVTLDLIADGKELIATIKRHLDLTRPALVALDTLNRSLRGNENDSKDMSAYVRAADAIRAAFNCAVIIVHHCGITGDRPRGHTSLTGAVEAQLAVRRDKSETIIVEVECAKDGPQGDIVASRLEKVVVGIDSDGEEISSCVVRPEETPAATAREPKISKNLQTMLALLQSAEPNGLTTDDWNARARTEGIGVKRRADLVDYRLALKAKNMVREYADRWHVAS
jgi:hypothetical protein